MALGLLGRQAVQRLRRRDERGGVDQQFSRFHGLNRTSALASSEAESPAMRHTVADLRGALRALVRTPGFAVTAILSIAIGVGANTAIFSVASALLLRPLPYRDADRLVILWNRSPGIGVAEDWFSTAQYFDIVRAHRRVRDRSRLRLARTGI